MRRWAVVFVKASTVALYSEYYALAFVFVFVLAALLVFSEPRRWRLWCTLGALPYVLFVPWLAQMQRSAEGLGVTGVTRT